MNERTGFWKRHGSCIAAVILIAILLLPMLAVSYFANPAADDFSRMADLKEIYTPGSGIGSYLSALVKLSNDMYYNWQGAYTVNYLIHLNPMLFTEHGYLLSYVTMILLFLLSFYTLSATVLKYLFKDNIMGHKLWLTAVLIFLCTQFINPAESFYWYAGIVAYTLPFLMLLITICTMIRCHYAEGVQKWLWFALSLALTFLNAGGCLMLSFIIPMGLAMYLVYLFVRKSPNRILFICYFAVAAAGFIIQAFSPGSGMRMGMFTHHTPLKTILLSILTSAETLMTQVTIYPIIAMLIALFPIALKVGSATQFKFGLPGLVFLCSLTLYSAAFAPILYGYGGYGLPPRYANTLYFLLVFLLAGNLFYTSGWLRRRYDFRMDSLGKKLAVGALVVVSMAASMGEFPAVKWTTPMIARSVMVGAAPWYKATNDKIISELKSSPGKDVVLTIPKINLNYFKKFELTEDPENMSNRYMAKYYGNNSIVALPPEE